MAEEYVEPPLGLERATDQSEDASGALSSRKVPSADNAERSAPEPSDLELQQYPNQQDHPVPSPQEQIDTEVEANGSSNRTVRRVLWGKHIFMITFSGVLGIGFYTRSGTILRTAGQLALFLAFTLLTALAWGVMQCITEMLSIWSVPGALVEFVRTFLDEDLATMVGIAYWFTYAITFPTFTTAIAGDLTPPKAIDGSILFFLVPIIIVFINGLGVRLYGFLELVGGSIKMAFALAIIICMCAINAGAGVHSADGLGRHDQYWRGNITPYDDDVATTWVAALFLSISLACFAFVGIEIPAATALEARVQTPSIGGGGPVDRTVRFAAVWVSIIAGCIYILGALLVSFDLKWDDVNLPRVSWLVFVPSNPGLLLTGTSNSAFIIAGKEAKLPGLAGFITVGLIISALTAANTTLYVASRTLFGLTREMEAGPKSPWIQKFLSFLGKTNRRKVPMRAIVASCCFCWVPFLYLSNSDGSGTNTGALIEVLSDMGSVSCVMVWALECLAYIRFYHCIKRHQDEIERREIPYLRRSRDDYPYRSHGQPFTAYLSVAGCLFILIIANGASLWMRFRTQPFLSAYLSPLFFIALWVGIKLYRGKYPWRLVDLSNPTDVINRMERLDRLRCRNTASGEEVEAWYNLWGWFEKLDRRNIRL